MHGKLEKPISIAVLTISDTRTFDTDKGGKLVQKLAEEAGIIVFERKICRDELKEIRQIVQVWCEEKQIDGIITTGGTGIARRDNSIEAILPLLTKEMLGFGELFRYLSFTEDIGTKAMLSRAIAGVIQDKAIFVLPGSTGAVKLAMEKLILPEIGHVVFEIKK